MRGSFNSCSVQEKKIFYLIQHLEMTGRLEEDWYP
ncbi:hypothetical protein PMIT1303_01552 [Prochlorococcus sp. MIT 1303]|nr:hypothetical protein PMIT1303_01552 [Prochlorococcus sp. MIT 1303]